METFLDKLAQELLNKFEGDLLHTTVVLPNRRSRVFLLDALKRHASKSLFAPEILSIQELVEQMSQTKSIDGVESLFLFYKVYCNLALDEQVQSFDRFAPWAKVLLKDFAEIDSYLVDPDKILNYLEDIKEIEHWALSAKKTEMVEKHLKFWRNLPKYYHAFHRELQSKNLAYQGLQFKLAYNNKETFLDKYPHTYFVFAGFNALMPSEEKMIKYFLKENRASIYWDIDQYFLNDSYNQTGYYIRKFKDNWSYYKSNAFQWIEDSYSEAKKIHIIGTAKSVGQAKIVGNILEEQLQDNPDSLSKTALVLSEKSLLIPMLYSLPQAVGSLNITLEYSAKNNPIQFLVNRLFRLHLFSNSTSDKTQTYYYKDVIEILSNPYIEPYLDARELIDLIKTNNYTFITQDRLLELMQVKSPLFELIFSRWPQEIQLVLDRIQQILLYIKSKLNTQQEFEKVALTFVFEINKVIIQLKNYFSDLSQTHTLRTLYGIYRQVIDAAEVAFEGEPLSGLQIMGLLESRTLDFENVIITSVNEGKIPFGKSQNSFIPYDVKLEFGLPTYADRDRIYTYHFYRLIQRAKNIYLIYNTEDEGLDGGEKSRFITQLQIEKRPNHELIEKQYNAYLPVKPSEEMYIEKSDSILTRLTEIATKGFSPSSLSMYVRDPLEFYYQRVLRINENKEVEETIEANTLGNVIHRTLEELYTPHLGVYLSTFILDGMLSSFEDILRKYFKEEYKQGDITRGKNLLAFETAKRGVYNFLKMEYQRVENGQAIKVLFLEQELSCVIRDSRLPHEVVIKGNLDRVEQVDQVIRIVDYKTGKVEPSHLTLNSWEQLLGDPQKSKIIQLLTYAYMYRDAFGDAQALESGIISFKNSKKGFMPYTNRIGDKNGMQQITQEDLQGYYQQIIDLLVEIFNPEIPFIQK